MNTMYGHGKLYAREDLGSTGRGEDITRDRSGEHATACVTSMGWFVACATAGDEHNFRSSALGGVDGLGRRMSEVRRGLR